MIARTLSSLLAMVVFSSNVLAASQPNVIRFKRLHVRDKFIGTEAFTMLVPADWMVEGGVVWRPKLYYPASAAMRITSPDGHSQFEILPQMPFVDGAREANIEAARMAGPAAMEMMARRFAEGQLYYGNEILRQVHDPAAFIRQLMIPRFRADLRDARIVTTEALPQVAQTLLEMDPPEAGTRKNIRAGRTRIEFSRGGQTYEEDLYCVLTFLEIPAIRQTFWNGEHLLAFRSIKGQLDGQAPILRTICNSFRINLKWYNKYVQLVRSLIEGQKREIQAIGEFSRRWAQMSDEVSRDRQKSWEDRQARQDEVNRRWDQHNRGLEDYRDADGNRVELPAGYNHAWISRGGEYIVTSNPNFNPNVEMKGDWTPLEPVK